MALKPSRYYQLFGLMMYGDELAEMRKILVKTLVSLVIDNTLLWIICCCLKQICIRLENAFPNFSVHIVLLPFLKGFFKNIYINQLLVLNSEHRKRVFKPEESNCVVLNILSRGIGTFVFF